MLLIPWVIEWNESTDWWETLPVVKILVKLWHLCLFWIVLLQVFNNTRPVNTFSNILPYTLPTHTYIHMYMHMHWEKSMWAHSKKVALSKPGREPSPDLRGTMISDFQPHNYTEIHLCSLSYSALCGILLWQPEQTNTCNEYGRAEINNFKNRILSNIINQCFSTFYTPAPFS